MLSEDIDISSKCIICIIKTVVYLIDYSMENLKEINRYIHTEIK